MNEANLLIGGEHYQIFYTYIEPEKGSYDCPSYSAEINILKVIIEGEEDFDYDSEDLEERILNEYYS